MSVVVSVTSPIRALHHLHETDLLHRFYGTVLIPPAVARKLASPPGSLAPIDVQAIPFVTVRAPTDVAGARQLSASLDVGEIEAIALAIEVRADLLLIDEMIGRRAAAVAGLPHIGVIGVFARAKRERLISDVRSRLDRLRTEINFFISDRLYQQVLRDLGE